MAIGFAQIAAASGGELVNRDLLGKSALDSISIERPADLAGSTLKNVCFFFSRDYQADIPRSRPGIIVAGAPFAKGLMASGWPGLKETAILSCEDPYLAMAKVTALFVDLERPREKKIHASAVVSPKATLGSCVEIGPHAVIDEGAVIGDGTRIHSGAWIGKNARLGKDCVVFANTAIYEETQIGDRVRIHANTTLGADGFGYAPIRKDGLVTGHQKIFHTGHVVIGDDVEIGANTSIDRGTFGETRVGRMSKIDNNVQIGHNVELGEGVIVCGSVGMAGGGKVGDYSYIGGMVGVSKVEIGARANIAATTLVAKDVEAGAVMAGNPMRDFKAHFRVHAWINRMMKKDREGS